MGALAWVNMNASTAKGPGKNHVPTVTERATGRFCTMKEKGNI